MGPSPGAPEQRAPTQIDAALVAAGWIVQDRDAMNLSAGRGVAVREFRLGPGHGFADYLLFVDGKAAGVLEAKPEGHTLSGVEVQAEYFDAFLVGLTRVVRAQVILGISGPGGVAGGGPSGPRTDDEVRARVHHREAAVADLARETAGLSTDAAARRIRVTPERLVEWEAGTSGLPCRR